MKAWFILLSSLILVSCGGAKSASTATSSDNSSNSSNEASNGSSSNGGSTTAPASFKLTCEEAQFIKLLNLYRTSLGKGALVVSKAAVIAGRWHAQDMINNNYFDHTEPTGRNPFQRGIDFGASISGENIAAGNSSAANTFCQWKNSSGHNANMINAGYKSTGIGRAVGGSYRYYWSSNFGGAISDALSEPLISDASCAMPAAIPSCT